MTTDDSDIESSNPSKNFKVGDFDRLSGFFTPVWESKRRIRSESPIPSSGPGSPKRADTAPSSREGGGAQGGAAHVTEGKPMGVQAAAAKAAAARAAFIQAAAERAEAARAAEAEVRTKAAEAKAAQAKAAQAKVAEAKAAEAKAVEAKAAEAKVAEAKAAQAKADPAKATAAEAKLSEARAAQAADAVEVKVRAQPHPAVLSETLVSRAVISRSPRAAPARDAVDAPLIAGFGRTTLIGAPAAPLPLATPPAAGERGVLPMRGEASQVSAEHPTEQSSAPRATAAPEGRVLFERTAQGLFSAAEVRAAVQQSSATEGGANDATEPAHAARRGKRAGKPKAATSRGNQQASARKSSLGRTSTPRETASKRSKATSSDVAMAPSHAAEAPEPTLGPALMHQAAPAHAPITTRAGVGLRPAVEALEASQPPPARGARSDKPGAASAALKQAGPNLPTEAFLDPEPELRPHVAMRASPARAEKLAVNQRALRASAAATAMHEQLRAKLQSRAASFPDSGGFLDPYSEALPVALPPHMVQQEQQFPQHLLRRMRRTIRLSAPLPEELRALIAKYDRD